MLYTCIYKKYIVRGLILAKVLGQTTPLKIMSGIYKSGRLHHAYLFYGDEGIGKFESALNYAKAICC